MCNFKPTLERKQIFKFSHTLNVIAFNMNIILKIVFMKFIYFHGVRSSVRAVRNIMRYIVDLTINCHYISIFIVTRKTGNLARNNNRVNKTNTYKIIIIFYSFCYSLHKYNKIYQLFMEL